MEHYIDFGHYEMVITAGKVMLLIAIVLALVGLALDKKNISLADDWVLPVFTMLLIVGSIISILVEPLDSTKQLTTPLEIERSGDITLDFTPLGHADHGTAEATTPQGRAVDRVLNKAYALSKGKGYVSLEVSSKKAEAVLTMKKGKPYKIVSKIDSMKTVNADAKGGVEK
ncbi:hypothetical protein [Lacticaseibacillus suibinensis]|uniref:hypothetical protein n=1 Tax=Lacticaseibacillus suibinensis TaxID=2486011 RepID=UPI000F7A1E9B|nr:hypothetical protein [Lacticaseibacillus suibinensis]